MHLPRHSFAMLLRVCAFAVLLVVSAEDFFLTEQEIQEAMNGTNRTATGLAVATRGNQVVPLIDGENAMAAIFNDVSRARRGDYVHLMAWDLNLDLLLKPRVLEVDKTRLGDVFTAALDRGVDVRVLFTDHRVAGLPDPRPVIACRELNKHCRLPSNTCCAPDRRGNPASHHAKAWAMAIGDEQIAYVGGMDMTSGRWDTSRHRPHSATREREPLWPFTFPWHDEQFRVVGPGADGVERTFWQRWHDPQEPFPGYSLPPYEYRTRGLPQGDLDVQVLRTVGCASAAAGNYQNFAPHGDYSNAAAFYKAVARATDYIYLEDQFMFFKEALDAVAARLPHLKHGVILVSQAGEYPLPPLFPNGVSQYLRTLQHYQYLAWKRLMDSPHRGRVRTYTLRTTDNSSQIYLHAKTMIVDDEYVLMGSCGMESNAFTSNFEINIGIQGPSSNPSGPLSFAGALRRRIWSEFLRLNSTDKRLYDVSDAIEELERQASLAHEQVNASRLHRYRPVNYIDWYDEYIWPKWEADGRCKTETAQIVV